ncbi:hypothetical protein HMPREF9622_01888 [Cutibacterium modestum HL037PA3]|uniref:Uncharacterized protein n=1 Tax=Cutibacterium modestum HL044PA1 TaxID=765109 RepID=A0ABP2KAQ4_9ACTN|nr:hypothetical protein HMPREF9621_02872 [Cutibacterium modestum HL037PA2]EFS92850.1 hypothetical protein HMPREF9607_00904 [Cutibacterium modestum HL044PA1]EFT15069.1 hypothetical protein HMPREF9622_01888 [Cutibacterium modestum HL037PA3]
MRWLEKSALLATERHHLPRIVKIPGSVEVRSREGRNHVQIGRNRHRVTALSTRTGM